MIKFYLCTFCCVDKYFRITERNVNAHNIYKIERIGGKSYFGICCLFVCIYVYVATDHKWQI